jgi:beta-glucosidase
MNSNVGPRNEVTVSLDEAIRLTTGANYWTTVEAKENGIRSIRLADGPHGLRVQDDENPDHLGLERSAPATCFPPAVTLASSWDEKLVETIGEALGREARAAGVDMLLGPGLNIKRSPLCGRNFEYFSEDPFLAGKLAGASARGIQNKGVAACLKHYVANNQETDRLRVSVNIDERSLREIYLRAFQIALRESTAWSVMSSYNRINGLHVSENPWILTEILRGEWGFDGIVVSDWGAVRDPVAALAAGLDLRMPGQQKDGRIREAFEKGQLSHDTLLTTLERMRLLAERTAHEDSAEAADYEAHHALARRAAAESAVLLTNDGALPLSLSQGLRIGVIGALAKAPRYQGAGSSHVNPYKLVSGLSALSDRAAAAGATVEFAAGYALSKGTDTVAMIADAVALAKKSDVVILFLGLPGEYEAEGADRSNIDLPPDQIALLDALKDNGTTTVVAMNNGSAVTTASWRDSISAIVEFWLTGQAHGEAIADVLFGDVNPSGKLAETIPLRLQDTPSYLNFPGELGNVTYGEGIHVGYRYYDAREVAVDYPFGHGLSYTTFSYFDLKVAVRPLSDDIAFEASVTVRNTGARAGSEVVQLYLQDHAGMLVTAPRELRGWSKLRLAPDEAATVTIAVSREQLQHWHPVTRSWLYCGGEITVNVGSSSRDLRLASRVEIPGEPLVITLNAWSTLGEWLDHPELGPKLRAIFDERGGVKGRIGDLLSDQGTSGSVRGIPLGTVADFPGVPIELSDIEKLCAEA